MTTFGCDFASVDANKPSVDFAKFRAAGGSFVLIRGSYGYRINKHLPWVITKDTHLQRDWKQAKAAGLVCGAYLFPVLQAQQTPEEQVAIFVAALAEQGGLQPGIDFPPALDIEFPGRGIADTGLDRAGVMAWLRRAIVALKSAYGCWPVLYTSGRVWNSTDVDCLANPSAPDLVECPLWLAHYAGPTGRPAILPPPEVDLATTPTPWHGQWWIHQGQGDAKKVPGFPSTVDVNRFRTASPGDKGGHVEWLQKKLGVAVDGVYGPVLELAVKAFQTSKGLTPDGIVGHKSFAAISWT